MARRPGKRGRRTAEQSLQALLAIPSGYKESGEPLPAAFDANVEGAHETHRFRVNSVTARPCPMHREWSDFRWAMALLDLGG